MAAVVKFGAQNLTFLILALFVCVTPIWSAQTSTSGSIAGVVTDKSDAVAPSVDVKLQDDAKGSQLTTTTNVEGFYQFSFLAPGTYTLTCAHAGFEDATRKVEVRLGLPATVNIRLEIATNRTAVVVTEQAPLIRAENGDVSSTISPEQISQVPNPGNDLTYIVQAAPGMIMNTEPFGAGNFSNLGMPGTSNLFTVNGMMQNDLGANTNVSGALGLLLGANEMEEVAVVSNGYSQFGGAAGANVNYITKSGGNQFHGNAIYYWNGTALNANNWINNAFGIPRAPDHAHQWAGSLGGPIAKDKLFFFFNTEGLRMLLPAAAQQVQLPSPQFEAATIPNIDARFGPTSASDAFYKEIFALYNAAPGAAGAQPGSFGDLLGCGDFTGLGPNVPCAVHYLTVLGAPNDQWLVAGRVDWNVGKGDRVFLLIQSDQGHQPFYLDAISPLFNAASDEPSWQGQFVETHAFGPRTANQFLVSGWWQGLLRQPANLARSVSVFPTLLDWFSAGNLFNNLGGFDNSFPSGRNATHFQISDDFSKSMGSHNLGFGVDYLQAYVTVFGYSGDSIGDLSPLTLDAFFQGGFDPATPTIDYTSLHQDFTTQVSQRFTFNRLGIYAKDEWHLRPNFTIVPSLRLEHQSNPLCKKRCFDRLTGPWESVSHDPSQPYNQILLTNQAHAFQEFNNLLWGPRLSFAWQPLGISRNTVLRGGFGIFFDPLPASLISPDYFSGNSPLVNTFVLFNDDNLTPGETTSLFKDAAASNAGFLRGLATGQTLAQIQAAFPAFSPPGGFGIPEAKIFSPQYQKWSFELQQGFAADTKVTIGYYGNHGLHELLQNQSANAFGFGSFPAGLCSTPAVPPCADPRFSTVTVVTNAGVSNYNGMVVSFEHRFTHLSQGVFQANYTFGHAFDEASNGGIYSFTTGSSLTPQDPNNIRGSYGPAEYDVRHSFNASYVLQVPFRAALRGHGPAYLVDGWQVSGTVFARTGFPYTVFDFNEIGVLGPKNDISPIYAVPVAPLGAMASCGEGAAQPASANPCLPPQTLPSGAVNPSAFFVQSGCETGFNEGNAGVLFSPPNCPGGKFVQQAQGRNHFRGPGYVSTDFSVLKNFRLPRWEKGELGVGAQFFNFFNHPNFGFPVNDISNSQFGQIPYLESPPTTILGSGLSNNATARMIQLRLHLRF
jgi:hypothetical protein